ncbi:MAG: hypothetical protein Q9225_004382 [Loekoesia sp. 1 TL-2023]
MLEISENPLSEMSAPPKALLTDEDAAGFAEFIDRRHYNYLHRESTGAAYEREHHRWLNDYSAMYQLCTQLNRHAVEPDTSKTDCSAEIDTYGNTLELKDMPENLKLQRYQSFRVEDMTKMSWSYELIKLSMKVRLMALEYNKARYRSLIRRLQPEAD